MQAILDGLWVETNEISATKHKFIGMFRKPRPNYELHICTCGRRIDTYEEATEHYLMGHDDIPQYVTTEHTTTKKQTQCNKICKNCMFFETYFENWSPMDMCEHVKARGLYEIEHVRYTEKLCGKSGRWYVERPKEFDKLPYDERQKIRKQNE